MKTYPMVAIAALGVWMAGSASVQAETSQNINDLTARTAIQDVALAGPGVDRHPPLATQYAELTRYGVDRHPPAMTQVATLSGPVDRHPPVAIQVAAVTLKGIDRFMPPATQVTTVTPKGINRFLPPATQIATLSGPADRHPPAAAVFAGLDKQEPIQVVLQFGTETKNFALTPETLRLEKGKLYKLVIVNPSKTAHVVSAHEFGVAIDSISLMRGVALKQGEQQAWYFVADQAGTYDIMCAYKAHADAGMMGKIIVG
jgi:uncharacterized cupredoxin-like copper-binding protein